MSARIRELAEKQALLQQRCALQRASVASEVDGLQARFASLDRLARLAQGALLHPAVMAAGFVALFMLGRAGGVRLLGRALLLGLAARRLIQAARSF